MHAPRGSLLFCDEPTSGLSSTDTEVAIRLLKTLCRKFNLTILVVIHQPKQETAALFDDLVLLTSQPGRVVYHGSMAGAFDHYAAVGYPVPAFVNPADYYLDMVSPGYKLQQSDKFAEWWKTKVRKLLPNLLPDALFATLTKGTSRSSSG